LENANYYYCFPSKAITNDKLCVVLCVCKTAVETKGHEPKGNNDTRTDALLITNMSINEKVAIQATHAGFKGLTR
jgi:hypothetical protein